MPYCSDRNRTHISPRLLFAHPLLFCRNGRCTQPRKQTDWYRKKKVIREPKDIDVQALFGDRTGDTLTNHINGLTPDEVKERLLLCGLYLDGSPPHCACRHAHNMATHTISGTTPTTPRHAQADHLQSVLQALHEPKQQRHWEACLHPSPPGCVCCNQAGFTKCVRRQSPPF